MNLLTQRIITHDRGRFALVVILLFFCLTLPFGCDRPVEAKRLFTTPEFRVAPSSGCGLTNPGSQTSTLTMPDASVRNFRVDAPPWWDGTTAIPIVYTFHACGGDHLNGTWNSLYYRTAQQQWLAPGLQTYDALIVMGDASGTCWNIAPGSADLAYAAALRQEIESTYCVDTERRYHAGASSGAFAAQAYACRLGGVAGVYAAHGGLHYPATIGYGLTPSPMPESCENPTPVLLMNSTTDTTVPIATYGYPARTHWLEQNGCDPESAEPFVLPVPAGGVGGTSCTSLSDCACVSYECSEAPVVWCEHSGTHTQWGYYRDAAANWFAPLTWVPEEGGSSSSGTETAASSEASTVDPSASTTACECVCP